VIGALVLERGEQAFEVEETEMREGEDTREADIDDAGLENPDRQR
jgi:hypothetical protein